MNEEQTNMKGLILATILCALVIIISRYLFPVAEVTNTPQTTPSTEVATPAVQEAATEAEKIYPVGFLQAASQTIHGTPLQNHT